MKRFLSGVAGTRSVMRRLLPGVCSLAVVLLAAGVARAGEADLAILDLHEGKFDIFGFEITAWNLLFYGALAITGTLGISLYLRAQIHKLPGHK